MLKKPKTALIALGLSGAMLLTACTPGSVSTDGSAYYDSMMWNDYYYGSYRPGYHPPDRPDKPDLPDRPVRPPGGGIDPGFSRPPAANKPIHRPSGGRAGVRGRR